jgi:RNA:NAD 2'-phosphotransferase (TPT1/KptA family)
MPPPSGSKRLVKYLRHHAAASADSGGWVPISKICEDTLLDKADVLLSVDLDLKNRFQSSGDRVRACAGHTFSVPELYRPLVRNPLVVGYRTKRYLDIKAQGAIFPREQELIPLLPPHKFDHAIWRKQGELLVIDARSLSLLEMPNGLLATKMMIPAVFIINKR